MSNLATKTATAALIATAIVTPTAVALNHTGDDSSKVKLVGDPYVRTELFFGTDKPGPDVTDWQFQQFINKTVTPRFPYGLTVLSGNGQWQEDNGSITKERSKVLILLYPVEEQAEDSKKIEEIRDKYKKQFQQSSVGRADSTEQVNF